MEFFAHLFVGSTGDVVMRGYFADTGDKKVGPRRLSSSQTMGPRQQNTKYGLVREVDPMLGLRWASVVDAGPTLTQNWDLQKNYPPTHFTGL